MIQATKAPNRLELIAKKNELYALIKFVGDYYGEPLESLREYAKEVVQNYIDNLEPAIECFRDLKSQCEVKQNGSRRVCETAYKPFRELINRE